MEDQRSGVCRHIASFGSRRLYTTGSILGPSPTRLSDPLPSPTRGRRPLATRFMAAFCPLPCFRAARKCHVTLFIGFRKHLSPPTLKRGI